MSVLIKGMEMPTEGTVIAIYKLDGKFFASVHGTELCPIVEVLKPHADLIERDAWYQETMQYSEKIRDMVKRIFDAAPTIIPKEISE